MSILAPWLLGKENEGLDKSGTTSDFIDAWFLGFSPSLTCGVWIGFDDRRSLGPKEEGAHAALPIWMDFMGEALKDQPVEDFAYSPLLTKPEQVKEILASTGTERLLEGEGGPNSGMNESPVSSTGTKDNLTPNAKPPGGHSSSTVVPSNPRTPIPGSPNSEPTPSPAAEHAGSGTPSPTP